MFFTKKKDKNDKKIRLIWLHGWGRDKNSFIAVSNFFKDCENILIDLPGFGAELPPKNDWGTEDYAKYLDNLLFLNPKNNKTFIIGHSFGCRVGLRFAYLYPEKISGLILISAAGLKKKRSLFFKIKAFLMKLFGKMLTLIDKIFKTSFKELYSKNFGSYDYRNAQGIMKSIFVKTIKEDLSNIAAQIKTKTLLIYGEKDQDTPPEFGRRYNKLIKNSQYFELRNFDHNDILLEGKFQLQNLITKFINS